MWEGRLVSESHNQDLWEVASIGHSQWLWVWRDPRLLESWVFILVAKRVSASHMKITQQICLSLNPPRLWNSLGSLVGNHISVFFFQTWILSAEIKGKTITWRVICLINDSCWCLARDWWFSFNFKNLFIVKTLSPSGTFYWCPVSSSMHLWRFNFITACCERILSV